MKKMSNNSIKKSENITDGIPINLSGRKIWHGILQRKTSGEVTQIACEISENSENVGSQFKSDLWPPSLQLRVFPKALSQDFSDASLKTSKTVVFHMIPCKSTDLLTDMMKSDGGYVGCVEFESYPALSQCGIRLVLMFYIVESDTYLGIIPNDQERFCRRLGGHMDPGQQKRFVLELNEGLRELTGNDYPRTVSGHSQTSQTQAHTIQNDVRASSLIIWCGQVEWSVNCGNSEVCRPGQRQIFGCISTHVMVDDLEKRGKSWPTRIAIQFIPEFLVHQLDLPNPKNSRSVIFHFTKCEELDAMREFILSGFAGYIQLSTNRQPGNCEVEALILLYIEADFAWIGYLPRDQTGFDQRLRENAERDIINRAEAQKKAREKPSNDREMTCCHGSPPTTPRKKKKRKNMEQIKQQVLQKINKFKEAEEAAQRQMQQQIQTPDPNVQIPETKRVRGFIEDITPDDRQLLAQATDAYTHRQYNAAVLHYKRYTASMGKKANNKKQLHLEIIVKYLTSKCLLQLAEFKQFNEAHSMLADLEATAGSRYPMIYYGLAQFYIKVFSFKDADSMANSGLKALTSADLSTCYIPESDDPILESTVDGLKKLLLDIKDQCSGWHPPDAKCFMTICKTVSSNHYCGRDIFFKSSAYNGLVTMICNNAHHPCEIAFHLACWRYKKDQISPIAKASDREVLLNWKCLTPDCGTAGKSSLIKKIRIHREDGTILDVEPPVDKYERPHPIADPSKGVIRKQKLGNKPKISKIIKAKPAGDKRNESTKGNEPAHSTNNSRRDYHINAAPKVLGANGFAIPPTGPENLSTRNDRLIALRNENFNISVEDDWRPSKAYYGNEHMISTIHSSYEDFSNDSAAMRRSKSIIFDHFLAFIERQGPITDDVLVKEWTHLTSNTELSAVAVEVEGVIRIRQLLLQSLKFVAVGDYLAIPMLLPKAYALVKKETEDRVRKLLMRKNYMRDDDEAEIQLKQAENIDASVEINSDEVTAPIAEIQHNNTFVDEPEEPDDLFSEADRNFVEEDANNPAIINRIQDQLANLDISTMTVVGLTNKPWTNETPETVHGDHFDAGWYQGNGGADPAEARNTINPYGTIQPNQLGTAENIYMLETPPIQPPASLNGNSMLNGLSMLNHLLNHKPGNIASIQDDYSWNIQLPPSLPQNMCHECTMNCRCDKIRHLEGTIETLCKELQHHRNQSQMQADRLMMIENERQRTRAELSMIQEDLRLALQTLAIERERFKDENRRLNQDILTRECRYNQEKISQKIDLIQDQLTIGRKFHEIVYTATKGSLNVDWHAWAMPLEKLEMIRHNIGGAQKELEQRINCYGSFADNALLLDTHINMLKHLPPARHMWDFIEVACSMVNNHFQQSTNGPNAEYGHASCRAPIQIVSPERPIANATQYQGGHPACGGGSPRRSGAHLAYRNAPQAVGRAPLGVSTQSPPQQASTCPANAEPMTGAATSNQKSLTSGSQHLVANGGNNQSLRNQKFGGRQGMTNRMAHYRPKGRFPDKEPLNHQGRMWRKEDTSFRKTN